MLTINDIKKESGIFNIPKEIHVSKDICFDFRLFSALVEPNHDGEGRDYKYDFDIYLPKYGVNLQRPYVWENCQRQEYILSIIQEKPLESVVIIQHNNDTKRENTINFVLDGKQRLMTIQKFGRNEFPIFVNGKEYYFKDFDKDLKLLFERRVNYLTGTVYYTYDDCPLTDDMRITLFNYYNFSGTPQTEEHKNMLKHLLEPKVVNEEFETAFAEFEKKNPNWKEDLTDSTYYELAEWYDEYLGISNPESVSDKSYDFADYVWDNKKILV